MDTISRLVLVFATSTPIWGSGSNQETQLVVVLYEETEGKLGSQITTSGQNQVAE